MNKNREQPTKQIRLNIGSDAISIDFPNNGQLIDIEGRKHSVSLGKYNELCQQPTREGKRAKLLVDMFSTFSVLMPDMFKFANKNVFDVPFTEAIPFLKAYQKEFVPWFDAWQDYLDAEYQEMMEDESIISKNTSVEQ